MIRVASIYLLFLLLAMPILAKDIWRIKTIESSSIKQKKMIEIQGFIEKYLIESGINQVINSSIGKARLNEAMLNETQCDSNCSSIDESTIVPTHIFDMSVERVKKEIFLTLNLRDAKNFSILKSRSYSSSAHFSEFINEELKEWIIDFSKQSQNLKIQPVQKIEFNSAVLPLKNINVDEGLAPVLGNRLSAELYKTQKFVLLEREQINEVLKAQAMQSLMCDEEDCAVELGKIIGVKQLISGSIARVGPYHSLYLSLIDVESSKILRSGTVENIGDNEVIFEETIEDGARLLAGLPPIERFNKRGFAWLSTSIGLALLGGVTHYFAVDYNEQYNKERFSVAKLQELKGKSQSYYFATGVFYALSAISAGVSIYEYTSEKREIKILTNGVQIKQSF
jgi:hypothetical protein